MLDFDELVADAPEWYVEVDYSIARDRFDEAAKLLQDRAADAEDEEKCMLALASAKMQTAKAEPRLAKRKATEALKLAKSLGEERLEAAALHRLAKVRLTGTAEESEIVGAMEHAEEALKIYQTGGNKIGEGSVLATLAKANLSVDNTQAQKFANDASFMLKMAGQKQGQASALHVLFSLMSLTGRLENARVMVEEMTRCYNAVQDNPNKSTCRLLAAQLHLSCGRINEAMAAAEECRQIAEEIGDEKKLATVGYLMASILENSGDINQAETLSHDAWTYFRYLRDKRGMAATLEVLAKCAIKKGQHVLSVQRLEEAASLYHQLKDTRMEAKVFVLISQFMAYGTDKSKDFDEKMKPVQYSMTAAETYRNLGSVGQDGHISALLAAAEQYSKVETNHETAILKAEEALQLSRDAGRPMSELQALTAVAGLRNRSDWDFLQEGAMPFAEDALSLAEKVGDQDQITAAQALVDAIVAQGSGSKKKKTTTKAGGAQTWDGYVARSQTNALDKCVYMVKIFGFESRVASHMVKKEASSSSGRQEEQQDLWQPSKHEVFYDLQWHKVTKDMVSLPIPLDEMAQRSV